MQFGIGLVRQLSSKNNSTYIDCSSFTRPHKTCYKETMNSPFWNKAWRHIQCPRFELQWLQAWLLLRKFCRLDLKAVQYLCWIVATEAWSQNFILRMAYWGLYQKQCFLVFTVGQVTRSSVTNETNTISILAQASIAFSSLHKNVTRWIELVEIKGKHYSRNFNRPNLRPVLVKFTHHHMTFFKWHYLL